MPPTRLQRSGATLDDLRDAVRTEFGAGARIVGAERVTSGGIGGLFRSAHVEATVEVPTATRPDRRTGRHRRRSRQRIGIAALLADAEAAEARIAGADGTSTARADAFASVLDGFVADGIAPTPTPALVALEALDGPDAPDAGAPVPAPHRASRPAPPVCQEARPHLATSSRSARPAPAAGRAPVPAVLSSDGDLVLLVGRMRDVDAAAGAFAARHGLHGTDAQDRRAGILARAEGVREGHALLGVAAWDDRAALAGLGAGPGVGRGGRGTQARGLAWRWCRRDERGVPVAGVVAIGTPRRRRRTPCTRWGCPCRALTCRCDAPPRSWLG